METKICKKCGRELPLENFSKNAKTKDGLQNHCRACASEYSRNIWKRKKAQKKESERIEFEKKYKVYTNRDLAKFTPRELMLELKARGYEGELLYIERIVKEHRINLGKLD
jgi:hypothetical protein